MTRTRDQERAKFAYERIDNIKRSDVDSKAYKRRVKNLGAQIRRDGLSTAIAFLERNKDEKVVQRLFDQFQHEKVPLSEHFWSANQPVPEQIRAFDLEDYMLATREILQLVQWMKRAAEAEIGEEDDSSQ